jgi:hypothetical protein
MNSYFSMKKQQNFSFLIFTLFFLFPFSLCWAEGKKDNGVQTQQQQVVPVLSASSSPSTVYWTGDGGKGIKIAVLEPSGKGLSETEKWMPSMVQSSITGDFQKYSAMTIKEKVRPRMRAGRYRVVRRKLWKEQGM